MCACVCVCGMYESAFSPFSHYVEERGRRGGGVSGNDRNKKNWTEKMVNSNNSSSSNKNSNKNSNNNTNNDDNNQ